MTHKDYELLDSICTTLAKLILFAIACVLLAVAAFASSMAVLEWLTR